MSKILLLEQNVINKIAAGEVVERPASVIKELVENSIDSGATSITIEIKQGGISFIRVTDNGNGIASEEILIAFERHATSKINSAEDIENISSLGFRGEALASIASVCQVECITKTRKSISGTLIQIHGGEVTKQESIGCPEGTTMFVRNIFYNTPARLKFLKSQGTEAGYISEIINKLALGNPHISFKFINNNAVLLHTNGNNDLRNVIFHVYGKDFLRKMLPIEYIGNIITIKGFIGKPELYRSNRSQQSFFINNRYIKSSLLSRAVEDAYKNLIIINKFPVSILHLTINPQLVDVNVHPTKLEVRFEEESEIYTEVIEAIKTTLKQEILIPEVKLPFNKPVQTNNYAQEEILVDKKPVVQQVSSIMSDTISIQEINRSNPSPLESYEQKINTEDMVKETNKVLNPKHNAKDIPTENTLESVLSNVRYIGQVFSTYIIVEKDNKLFMIDQHAAHEKVMYEKYFEQFKNAAVLTQQLILPLIIDVSYKEKNFIDSHLGILKQLGFDIDEFGPTSYAIRGVPMLFHRPAGEDFFREVIETLIQRNIKNIYELKADDLATMACKSAVKAHNQLSEQEIQQLIQQLFSLENPFNCPHGRPTIVSLTQYEIEKMFKRIQS